MILKEILKKIPIRFPLTKDGYSNYELMEYKEIQKLLSLLEHVEAIEDYLLTFRGEPFDNDEMKEIIQNKLGYIFCVGKKAESFLRGTKDKFRPFDKENIDKELKDLLKKSEDVIKMKSRLSHPVSGTFKIDKCRFASLDTVQKNSLRMLLLLFLHNKGNDNIGFKDTSSFISLSSEIKTSISFASSENGKNGVVYVYIMPLKEKSHQFKTGVELQSELKDCFEVNWYNDHHNEYILAGGMYPHKLLGLFTLSDGQVSEFILSPWAMLALKEDYSFVDFKVDQKDFLEIIKKEGLEEFFCCNSFIEESNIAKVSNMFMEKIHKFR
ncbi:hypothetical protein ABMA77_00920 [Halobacteriovorax sp. RZ-1]|uniref:hypothetical protein n=1 Tax=unclassified Halobacteriovorax TaxID=2639665 RepID=UPI003717C064